MLNKYTNQLLYVQDLDGGGVRIVRYHYDRVIYEDGESNPETVNKFVEIMDELQEQGFEYVHEDR